MPPDTAPFAAATPIAAAADTFPPWPPRLETARRSLLDVFDSGHWWQSGGGRAEAFEAWLADYHAAAGSVAVANGTVALELALRAAGIGAGDDVLVPALTFFSTASAVSAVGARPIPVDVNQVTLALDCVDARAKLTHATRAVIAVHLAGHPGDMDAVADFAEDASLVLLEDAAQAIGAEWRGRRVGCDGVAGTFSFHASKVLAGGEGGGIVTHDEQVLDTLRLLANCGRARGSSGYDHRVLGTNARMTEFQAALLLEQVRLLDAHIASRTAAAARLGELLDGIDGLELPTPGEHVTRTPWYMYVVRVSSQSLAGRDTAACAASLRNGGIPATRLYPLFHQTRAYAQLLHEYRDSCPTAEGVVARSICLSHRVLLADEQDLRRVADALRGLVMGAAN